MAMLKLLVRDPLRCATPGVKVPRPVCTVFAVVVAAVALLRYLYFASSLAPQCVHLRREGNCPQFRGQAFVYVRDNNDGSHSDQGLCQVAHLCVELACLL